MYKSINVLGTELKECSSNPMTGFFRDGCCNTSKQDFGIHTVCIIATKEFLEFSKKLVEKLSKQNVRADIDDRNDSIGKRIREAEKEWIRYILVIGEREAGSENLSIRDRNSSDVREISFDELISEISNETGSKPYSTLNLPKIQVQKQFLKNL